MSVETDDCDRLHVTGWYRSNLWNASQTFAKVFATVNLILVAGYAGLGEAPDFRRAFWIALGSAAIVAVAFMMLRLNARIER